MKNNFKLKYILFYLGILMIPVFVNTLNYQAKTKQYIQKYLEKEILAYDIIINSNLKTANDNFRSFVNRPEVMDILKKAQTPDKDIRDAMRNKLYTALEKDYKRIKLRDVRQFHFVLPNCESFLRFHHPERYGEDLTDIRYSMKKVNTELVAVYGFEEGVNTNGFRNVFPIIYRGQHLGAVEISMSYRSITNRMDKLFSRKHTFIIRKDIVHKQVIKSGLSNYKISDVCDKFLYENNEVIDDTTVQIFKQIHGQIHDKLQKGLTFVKETKYLGTHYLLAFHSIENIEGEHVAYVISYEEDETLHIYFNRFIQMLMIASMVVFIIFFLFFLTITKNSALKLVHKDLLHSEKRFKQLSNLTFEGIVIHDKGLILEVNLSMVTMFGYEAEEFIGQSINILLASDEDREIIKKNLIKNYAFPYEVNGMKKDGNIFPLEIEAKDLTDKDNNPIRVAAVRDISQKKKIQMDLKRSDARFRALFDKNSEPIMLSPLNDFFTHNIIDVNPAACKYLGYSREELLAIAPKDISRPVDNLDSFIDPKKIYEKLKADGNMLIFSNHITKSGNSIPVEVNLQLIDIDNEPIIFAIVRNISQRKQAEKALRDSEEQLRQSQKLEGIGQLAGGIAHDFNNILAAQYGLTDIALMNTEEGSKAHNALLQIKASNERAANLVRHILTFSRKQVFTPINLNINKTIENLNKMVQRLIGEDMEINIKLSPEKLFVNADPSQIEQIMINLFVNARDALKVQNDKTLDKQITITTEAVEISVPFITSTSAIEKGNYILISVKDTGIGMGKETLNQIFEPFYTTKEVGEGTGLGLSTVYGIVKQNNAYINAYSELGKGTTFKIYWPSTKEENQAQIIESSDKKNYEGDETILFVEDDEIIREILCQALSDRGYHVIPCSNGKEALLKAEELDYKFDILITDMKMPKMGGVELSEKILEKLPDMKIILCSGYNEESTLQSGMLEKNIPFLKKPFNSYDLTKTIRELLDN